VFNVLIAWLNTHQVPTFETGPRDCIAPLKKESRVQDSLLVLSSPREAAGLIVYDHGHEVTEGVSTTITLSAKSTPSALRAPPPLARAEDKAHGLVGCIFRCTILDKCTKFKLALAPKWCIFRCILARGAQSLLSLVWAGVKQPLSPSIQSPALP
jgi:hypothetical protein